MPTVTRPARFCRRFMSAPYPRSLSTTLTPLAPPLPFTKRPRLSRTAISRHQELLDRLVQELAILPHIRARDFLVVVVEPHRRTERPGPQLVRREQHVCLVVSRPP